MAKVVRVFWTLHQLKGTNTTYHKEKRETDFPEMTHHQEACDKLWNEHGKRGRDDSSTGRAPSSFADIQGWTVVELDRPKAELETFEAKEFASLLTSEMLRDSLMDSPRLKARRK